MKSTDIQEIELNLYAAVSKFRKSERYASYSLTVQRPDNHQSMVISGKVISPVMVKLSFHYAVLCALRYGIGIIKESCGDTPVHLIFFSGSPEVEFEWNTEYLEDGMFSRQTEDQAVWDDIVQALKNTNIRLTIGSSKSVYSSIDQVKRKFGEINR